MRQAAPNSDRRPAISASEQGAGGHTGRPWRTKFIDPDYRRDPKTDHYCCRCQKDLDPTQPYRMVHLVDGGPFALHPGDEDAYNAAGPHPGDMYSFYVGNDCARKIGLEWTHIDDRTRASISKATGADL